VILVDTSVWIDHLRVGDTKLEQLLNTGQVLMHPLVLGELACGNLHNRDELLGLLGELPQATRASDQEVLFFIKRHNLMGKGIGYIDAHLLAAVSLSSPARLWTRDKRLSQVAEELGLGWLSEQTTPP